jgi:hypothetical protein
MIFVRATEKLRDTFVIIWFIGLISKGMNGRVSGTACTF